MDNQFEYRRELDSLRFTPAQKAALTAQVTRAAAESQKPARRPVRRTLVLAAAATLVLALGVGAGATVLKLASDAFAPVFGTAQTEIIDKIGRPIDASCTDNGVTISADAIIGDKYNACIVYSITNADGTPLTLPEGAEAKHIFPDTLSSNLLRGGGSSSGWTTIDPQTGILQYVETISGNDPLKMGNTTAKFENLYYWDVVTQERVLFAEGAWTLKFEVNYEDSSVKLPAGQTFARSGVNFIIDEISISPVAIQVQYTADQTPDWGDDQESGRMSEKMEDTQSIFLGGIPLLLTLSDGTILDYTENSGGGVSPTKTGAECNKGTVFEQILPLEDVVSVTFGDVVIPVSAK